MKNIYMKKLYQHLMKHKYNITHYIYMNNQWYKLDKWYGMDWVIEDEKGEYIIYLKGNFENIYWEQYDGVVIISSIHIFPLEKLSSWYIYHN